MDRAVTAAGRRGALLLLVVLTGACGPPPSHVTGDAAADAAEARDSGGAAEAADGEGDAPGDAGGGDQLPDAGGRVVAENFSGTVALASFAPLRTGWSSALAVAGGLIVAVNGDSDSLTVVDEGTLEVVAEIGVGDDPRTVALTADGRYAAVANRGDDTVSLVSLDDRRELFFWRTGPMPYGVALAGAELFVTETARGDVAVLDVASRRTVARFAVGDSPAGIAAAFAPGDDLTRGGAILVTHLYSGGLTILDRASRAVTGTVSTGADTNLSQFVAVSPDGRRAYLPQTRSNADNPNRQFDTTVFPVVNVVELSATSPRLLNAARVTLDTADRPVAVPFAAELSRDGQTLWVANAASDDLSVIDLGTLRKVAHVETGAHPRGVTLSSDGARAFVNETLDGTLAVVDAATFAIIGRVRLTQLALDPVILAGKRLFHSAQRTDVARDQWMACVTCHFDNATDRRTWVSFPDGPRNTTALFNLEETLPLHWSGDLDELADVESTVRFIQAGTGLAPAPRIDTLGAPLTGASAALDALSAFLRALPAPRSPFQDDPAAIARGQAAFVALACAGCHPAPSYTDRRQHDVGTGVAALEKNSHGRGVSFDTPSLRALWLTPPYLHDGTAATLDDVFARGPQHDVRATTDAATRRDLVVFLRSL